MNTRIASTLFLAVLAVTAAHAQTELPSQWVDSQMKAARQDQRNAAQRAGAAVKAAAATSAAVTEVASQSPENRAPQLPRPVAKVAKMGSTTQE